MRKLFKSLSRRNLLALIATATVMSCVASPKVQAKDLNPAHVPADAKWVLHVDLDQLLDTELAQTVRERRPEIVQGIRQWIQQQYGIDPRSDLRSVTMFSKDYEEYTGSVVIQAKYDPQKVRQQLQQAEQLQKTQWDNLTLYTFQVAEHKGNAKYDTGRNFEGRRGNRRTAQRQSRDVSGKVGHDQSGGKEMTVVLLDQDTIVFGSSVENAKDVVGLLRGDQPSLRGKESQLLGDGATDAIMYGAAIKLNNITKQDLPMPVLKQHESINWVFGSEDDQLYETATLVGQSEDVAEKMEQVVRGFLAYETLWAADSEALTELVEAVEVTRDGKQLKVDWKAETDTVIAGLDDLMNRFEDWRLLTAR